MDGVRKEEGGGRAEAEEAVHESLIRQVSEFTMLGLSA